MVKYERQPDREEPRPVDKSPERIRRMFNQIAPRYDLLNHLLSLGIDRRWRRRTVRRIPPQVEGPILDVCTGTGDLALAWWRKYPEREIFGIDFAPEMIALGKRKTARFGAENRVHLTEGDALRLPFDSDRFAVVSVAFGLRNVGDTDGGIAEMARVCAPGGTVAVLEFTLPEKRTLRQIYLWYFRKVLPKIGQWIAPNRDAAYHYLPNSVGQFDQRETLLDRMRDAGLRELSADRMTFGTVTLYRGNKPRLGRTPESDEKIGKNGDHTHKGSTC
jgi:demethylmenaquinone methyltransferase/2-methoxy-6-polyprenyl-1,4-benzoquinol methylase